MLKKLSVISFLVLFTFSNTYADDKKFNEDWFSHNIKVWDNYKSQFNGLPNKRCLEIGSYEGRSSIYMAENFCNGKGSYIDAVDPWDESLENLNDKIAELHKKFIYKGLYERFKDNLKDYIAEGRVNAHRGKSADILLKLIQEVKEGKREKYDLIYIDGSHSAKDVLVDAVLAWELLKNDGLMLFDDYKWTMFTDTPWLNPTVAIDGFLNSYDTMYEVLHKDYQLHIRKLGDIPLDSKKNIDK
ncbi:MAG: class I SAM-dependent methyltransferase [Alphaproteobacteria bacterium]